MSQALERLARWRPPAGAARRLRYVLLDVFAARPLEGNQLAVFLDAAELDGALMQAVARELKLSETVFLQGAGGGGDVRLRIFTPAAELPFAGHPVLGAAVVLAGALDRRQVTLETGSGPVAVELEPGVGRSARARMSQPVPSWQAFPRAGELLGALGLDGSELPVEVYANGPRHVLVAASRADVVAALAPDLQAIERIVGAAGVSCFAGRGGGSYKTRMFAPGLGVPEDPATGSAAGPLAVHLLRHGRIAFGQEIEIEQGLEIGRPSLLRAAVEGRDQAIERVLVGGEAVLVGEGELLVPQSPPPAEA